MMNIRAAIIDDAEAIAQLAAELAHHQGEPVCRLDIDAVRRDGFGPDPAFACLLGELDGRAVGYALVMPWYEPAPAARGLYIGDLFVRPEARGHGLGRALIEAVAADAKRRGLSYVGWLSKPWNEAAHAFYRKLGAVHEPVVAHAVFGEPYDRLATATGRP